MIAAGAFVNALVHGHVGTALLFGLVGLGVFNVVRDLASKMAGRRGRV